jgi:hypothetical protein
MMTGSLVFDGGMGKGDREDRSDDADGKKDRSGTKEKVAL